MKTALLLFFCSAVLVACSQEDTATHIRSEVTYHQFTVGQKTLSLRQISFETELPFLLLHLHGDEATAAEAANKVAHAWGVQFIQLLNGQNRLVTFGHEGKTFQFDPNRIFSPEGIKKSLQLSGPHNESAFNEVGRFSDSLLSLLEQGKPIVAVHNNTDGRFNIRQYRDAGLGLVHVNEEQDPDDFFITNDNDFFELLQTENFNVVLEDASRMEEDGSLSLYSNRRGIRYINVEAQHGHLEEQLTMLEAVKRILK